MNGWRAWIVVSLLAAGCASTPGVDRSEPRRVLGREADVRLDAQVFGEQIGAGTGVRITWEVENLRPDPIAVADLIPSVSYDQAQRTLVVHLGSEVPGNELVPRLIRIGSGEKKVFTGVAKVNLHLPPPSPLQSYPRYLQLRLNFLSDVEPFAALIDIPENAVRDPQLADALFPKWIEANETIETNSLPIDWMGAARRTVPDASRRRF